jgi:hypothetical protein
MKRSLLFFLTVAFLLMAAQRLPAPIVEPEEKPTPAPEQSKAPKPKHSPQSKTTSQEPSSAKIETRAKRTAAPALQGAARFDGTWKGRFTGANATATYNASDILIIKDGKTVDATVEGTLTLRSGSSWDLPQQYRRLSPLYLKFTLHANRLSMAGRDLIIRWDGPRLIDWSPKTLPRQELQKLVEKYPLKPILFTLKGDELVKDDGSVYHRAK